MKLHIHEGPTIAILRLNMVFLATISNWIRAYREEFQTNDVAKFEYELMKEVNKLRQDLHNKEGK